MCVMYNYRAHHCSSQSKCRYDNIRTILLSFFSRCQVIRLSSEQLDQLQVMKLQDVMLLLRTFRTVYE